MTITFGRTAYVDSVGAEMLDAIERSRLSIAMIGDGLVCTTHEALEEYLSEQEEMPSNLRNAKVEVFLQKAFDDINRLSHARGRARVTTGGDIVFAE